MSNFKKVWVRLLMLVMILAVSLSVSGRAQARPMVEFELTNNTGVAMKSLYIAPAIKDTPWSTDFLENPIANGETVKVGFEPNADTLYWDMKMIGTNGKEYLWGHLELMQCHGVTVFMKNGKAMADVMIPVE